MQNPEKGGEKTMGSIFQLPEAKAGPKKILSSIDLEKHYTGSHFQLPYIYYRGKKPGPRGVILAGIHGDELNGIQIIHKISSLLTPENLHGELALIPMANIPGFVTHSRYLPDRRDLNRLFPGNHNGSEGSRLARIIWESFIEEVDFGIDLHSASYNRWNFPHVRGDMENDEIREMARSFGSPIILHSRGVKGSLRREAGLLKIPILLFEAGQTNRFEREVDTIGAAGILNILLEKGMLQEWPSNLGKPHPSETYLKKSNWVRAGKGGLFVPGLLPGDVTRKNQNIGEIRTLDGTLNSEVISKYDGKIIGFNLHPQVVPGRALYHIGYDEHFLS